MTVLDRHLNKQSYGVNLIINSLTTNIEKITLGTVITVANSMATTHIILLIKFLITTHFLLKRVKSKLWIATH